MKNTIVVFLVCGILTVNCLPHFQFGGKHSIYRRDNVFGIRDDDSSACFEKEVACFTDSGLFRSRLNETRIAVKAMGASGYCSAMRGLSDCLISLRSPRSECSDPADLEIATQYRQEIIEFDCETNFNVLQNNWNCYVDLEYSDGIDACYRALYGLPSVDERCSQSTIASFAECIHSTILTFPCQDEVNMLSSHDNFKRHQLYCNSEGKQ